MITVMRERSASIQRDNGIFFSVVIWANMDIRQQGHKKATLPDVMHTYVIDMTDKTDFRILYGEPELNTHRPVDNQHASAGDTLILVEALTGESETAFRFYE